MATLKNPNRVTTAHPHSKSAMKQTFPTNIKGARKGATKKRQFMLYGGPFDGNKIWLSSPTTTTFSSGKFKGRYRAGTVVFGIGANSERVLTPAYQTGFKGFDLIWEDA